MTDGRSRARLSVNVNKVATLRNSRGGNVPSVVDATRVSSPPDRRGSPSIHAPTPGTSRSTTCGRSARSCALGRPGRRGNVELNIEGDPRPDLLALADEIRPDQFTLVPVRPGEVTSQAGWDPQSDVGQMREFTGACRRPASASASSSIRIPPRCEWAATVGGDRIELYTEPFARAFHEGRGRESFELYSRWPRWRTSSASA